MKYVLLLVLLLQGCSTFGPSGHDADREWRILSAVAKDQHAKFTYVTDQEMWGVDHFAEPGVTGDEAFSGDCEEFALASWTQARRRGLMTAPVFKPNHVILCGRFWCIDNMHAGPFIRQ